MISKMLFIGVGGSGGTTLRYIWRELEDELRSHGWTGGMPSAWQFLHIDAPAISDAAGADLIHSMTGNETYLGLAQSDIKFPYYLDKIGDACDVLAGWRPNPLTGDTVPLWLGAGQRRAIGRIISLSQMDEVAQRLDNLLGTMSTKQAGEQLEHLATTLKTKIDPTCNPILVSSLGGGAGAGMFLDVALLLKAKGLSDHRFLQSTINVLYTPDIFDSLPPDKRSQIAGNTLGSVSELLAAHQSQGRISSVEQETLKRIAAGGQLTGQRVADVNFFIGRRSLGTLAFTTPREVYQVVARALVAMSMEDSLRDQLFNRVIPNHDGAASNLDIFKVPAGEEQKQPATSFGYSVVGTGGKVFAQYVAQRLARIAHSKLLNQAEDVKRQKSDDPQVFLNKSRQFAREAGLLELDVDGVVNDEILNAVKKYIHIDSEIAQVLQEINRDWSEAQRTPDQMASGLGKAFSQQSQNLNLKITPLIASSASEFSKNLQTKVFEVTLSSIARNGLSQTLLFLEQACEDLEAASKQLIEQSMSAISVVRTELNTKLRSIAQFASGSSDMVSGQNGLVKAALDAFKPFLENDTDRAFREIASVLAQDISENFVKPLRKSLESAQVELASSKLHNPRLQDLVDSWPLADGIPPHLIPTPNELLLEGVETFNSRFETLISETYNTNFTDALSLAVAEVMRNEWATEINIKSTQNRLLAGSKEGSFDWRPIIVSTMSSESGQALVTETIDFGVQSIKETSERWTASRNGVKQKLNQSLGAYLNENSPEAAGRKDRFIEKLSVALALSQPLTKFDSGALKYFHGLSEQELSCPPTIGAIPLDPDSEKGRDVLNLLQKEKLSPAEASACFNINSTSQEISITRIIQKFVHPFTMSTVIAPILERWSPASSSPAHRDAFWMNRRARTLGSFVPLTPTQLENVIRGWQVARTLGMISNQDLKLFKYSDGEERIGLWTPEGVLRFTGPQTTVTKPMATEVLPILLERIPLAMMELVTGDSEGLNAFSALARLGQKSDDTLARWIDQGLLPSCEENISMFTPEDKVAGTVSQTPSERRDTVIASLKQRKESLAKLGAIKPKVTELEQLSRAWELREVITKVLEQMMVELSNPVVTDDENDG
jgi:hypothetical protein